MNKPIKIGLITSRGGHLLQLYKLKPWWKHYPRFWVTDSGADSTYILKEEKIIYGYFPEHHNIINAARNFLLALKVLREEKPTLLVSMGAGIAPPFFWAGKLFGCKLIFIESISFVRKSSLSARLVSPIVDKLIFQHPYATGKKNIEYWGSLL